MNYKTILIFEFISENFYNPVKKIQIDNFEIKIDLYKTKIYYKEFKDDSLNDYRVYTCIFYLKKCKNNIILLFIIKDITIIIVKEVFYLVNQWK